MEAILAPIDHLRARILRAGGPALRPYLADREARVVAIALIGVWLAFVVTATMPLVSLALGPILLGVPHLAADLRYLVLRPGWPVSSAASAAVFLPLVGFALVHEPWLGLLASVFAAVSGSGSSLRRAATALAAAALTAFALGYPMVAGLVMAHAHNLIAVALWWWWRPGSRRRWVPVAAFAAGYGAILGGAFDRIALGNGFGDVSVGTLSQVAGTSGSGPWDHRLLLSFAFAQAVHYGVWLRWIPEDDRARRTPRPFAASWRAAVKDFGPAGAWATVCGTLLLVVWATFQLGAARDGYFSVAAFHGYLELAAVAGWCAGARRA